MNKFQSLSIKTKLISIQLFTTLFVLMFFVGIYLYSQYRQFEVNSFGRMSALAEIIGSNSVAALEFFDNDAASEVLGSLSTQSDITNAAIYDRDGNLFAKYDHPHHPGYDFEGITAPTRGSSEKHFFLTQEILSDSLGIGSIALRLDTCNRRAQLTKDLQQALLVFLIGLLLAGLLSYQVQKPISRSIQDLAQTARKIRESRDYSLRVAHTSHDEIGTLVDSFNSMLEKISNHEKHLEDLVAVRTAELEAAKLKAEESDHLKSAFLASMSHELRTPLNSIIGFTGILLQEMAGPMNDEQKKQLSMVKGSSSHLLDLINDVLDISKIESGRLEVHGEAFKIDILLIMTVSSLRPFAEKKGLTLEYDLEPDLPELHSDKRRLEQVLINLINNAIKFTDEGSIQVVCSRKADALSIEVIDTGIGLKEENQSFVFQTFRQVDTGLNRVKEGSGLGLAICKRLTELLGGTIGLESTEGKGSTFSVLIPFNLGKEPSED